MAVNPAIQACQNEYARMWWNGWLVGVLAGVAVSTIVVYLAWWAGALWI